MGQLCVTYYYSPIGWLKIVGTKQSIQEISFVKNKGRQNSCPYLAKAVKQLRQYFAGRLSKFNLDLELEGTAFQKNIWRKMINIPYAKTVAYNKLGPARAVGTACRLNKIPIIIPCHRVVPSAGGVGNYSGGIWRKRFLLNLEK